MRAEVSDLIRQLDQAGEIKPSDLPWLVTHIANEFGNLIRLSGAAVASVLRTHASRFQMALWVERAPTAAIEIGWPCG